MVLGPDEYDKAMSDRSASTPLAARLAALPLLLAVAAAIAWVHRDDLFPPAVVVADDPAAPCIAERHAGIDKMAAESAMDEAKVALFKSRAEALCRDQIAKGGAAQ